MIQINLLIKPKPTNWRGIGLLLGGLLVAAAVVYFADIWWVAYSAARNEVKTLSAMVSDFQAKVKLEPDVTAKEAQAQKARSLMEKLARNQAPGGQAKVLQLVLAAAPKDVTVSKVTFSGTGNVEIGGQSATWDSALAFRDNLKKVPGFSDVTDKGYNGGAGQTTFTFIVEVKREGLR